MKRNFLIVLSGIAVIGIMASMSPEGDVPLSSGAPVGSTNAPGEQSCGKAGCHTGDGGMNNINTGIGILSITSVQDITNYIPGATYDITVALNENGVNRFGFSLTALDENNNKAGTLIVTDEQRTQIFQGALQFADREYMTYRMVGTNPYQPGKGQWSFKWKAPDKSVGKITFYAGGISANNDATDKGDLVYTQTLSSESVGLTVNSIPETRLSFSVFPNPVKDDIHVRFNSTPAKPLTYALFDISGKLVSSLQNRSTSADGKNIRISVSGLSPGSYYLKIEGKGVSETKKILLIN